MNATPALFETLRELLAASNPGLATKDDLARLEERIDELDALVDELSAKLSKPAATPEQP